MEDKYRICRACQMAVPVGRFDGKRRVCNRCRGRSPARKAARVRWIKKRRCQQKETPGK